MNKFICLSVNMGIEVKIEISMGYIAIRDNLTQKWVFSQTWPEENKLFKTTFGLGKAHGAKNIFESKCGRKASVLQEEKKKRKKKKEKRISGMDLYGFLWFYMDISLFHF